MAERRPKSRKVRGLLALLKAIKEKKTERTSGARLNVSDQFDSPGMFSLEKTMAVNQPEGLRKFAQKKVDELGLDSSKIVGEGKEGLPLLLFHRSYGDPFKEFNLVDSVNKKTKSDYKFISTGLSQEPFKPGGTWTKAKDYNYPFIDVMGEVGPGARVLVGVGKVNKIFDHDNPEHVNKVINLLRKEKYKKLKKSKSKKKQERQQKIKDEFEDRLVLLKERMLKGDYEEIENNLEALRKLGYDSFTTFEGGKNVMLLKPNEQFVPLFDPLKKSAIGFAKGGMIARNPYDYESRGI